jgi:hypothetical protein
MPGLLLDFRLGESGVGYSGELRLRWFERVPKTFPVQVSPSEIHSYKSNQGIASEELEVCPHISDSTDSP